MRRSLLLCLLGMTAALLGNKPSPAPATSTAKEAPASVGIAMLTPAVEGMALLQKGPSTMGATPDQIRDALKLCKQDVLGKLFPICDEIGGARPFIYELYAHTTHLSTFSIDRTEVTVGDYRRCVIAAECLPATYPTGDPKFDRPELPVTHVSWEDARRYCAWRGKRLPTEAEWERAARGFAERTWPWGFLPNPKLANHGSLDVGSAIGLGPASGQPEIIVGTEDASDGFAGLAPVGSFPGGATPEGVHDLAGNVSEWVSDFWSDQLPKQAAGDPTGPPTGTLRVVRGGSFRHPMSLLRATSRVGRIPSSRDATIGFRCAR
jgi:formylglycine-generating enzyme required for sulfatase activity